ncbi:MAG: sulfite exporter TauE/SafE family protein [Gammaproteobacteria bacterium]|nr:sulfite exporter TauE/SafE family protein [Gammaproteobacteria bacterium]
MNEAQILLVTAASIAFLHTIMGPDHYVVFTAMGKARGWGLARTLRVTLFCGIGHVLSSVVIGAIGLLLGTQLASLIEIESMRGNLASWALLAFGLVYFAWGLKKAGRDHSHSHVHAHGEIVHDHQHDHHDEHAHVHSITPWAIFIILVLGPCEALIPLFMYPAAQQSSGLIVSVALVFGSVTLATMLAAVAITSVALDRVKVPATARRYAHAVAGASLALCGGAISFIGI